MNNKIYVLCEEFEGTDGIRCFTIIGVSQNGEKLKKFMNSKIASDDYGIIKKNGIKTYRETYFETYYEDGFIEYYITEEELI